MADKTCDEVNLDSCQIAIRYLKTWFLMDLISSLPLDYMILLFSPQATVRQLIRAGNHRNRCCNICSCLQRPQIFTIIQLIVIWPIWRCLKTGSDGAEVMSDDSSFHKSAPTTGNDRLSIVLRRMNATYSAIHSLYRHKPIHCNYQFVHYSGFSRISPSILNRFKPNLQA